MPQALVSRPGPVPRLRAAAVAVAPVSLAAARTRFRASVGRDMERFRVSHDGVLVDCATLRQDRVRRYVRYAATQGLTVL